VASEMTKYPWSAASEMAKCPRSKEQLLRCLSSGMAPEWQRLLVAWTCVMILCGSDFNHYKCPSLFCFSKSAREKQESGAGQRFLGVLSLT